MKSFTDIEQSKKLAEMLPIESADMHYVRKTHDFMGNPIDGEWSHPKYGNPNSKHANYIVQNFETLEKIPCWSLAALFELLPKEINVLGTIYSTNIHTNNKKWFIDYKCNNEEFVGVYSSSLVDACVEMILKLKEKNLL